MPYKDPAKHAEAQRRYNEKRKGKRHKVWTWIMYDESSPYWYENLEALHVAIVVSPVHDKDVWTKADERKNPKCKSGKLKKAHRHGMIEYENPVTYAEFMADMKEAGISTTNVKYVRSVRAMSRYLTHMDSPKKARYNDDEVIELSGASWREMCERAEDVHEILAEMRKFIVFNEVNDLWVLQVWADEQEDATWSRVLDSRVYGIEKFIASFRAWRKENPQSNPIAFLQVITTFKKPDKDAFSLVPSASGTSSDDGECALPVHVEGHCDWCGLAYKEDELVHLGSVGPEGSEFLVLCNDCAREYHERRTYENWQD